MPTPAAAKHRDLEQRLRDIERATRRRPGPAPDDTGWIYPTLETGWSPWVNELNEPICYRRIGDRVYLQGLCQRASGTGNVIFILPPDYRPPKNVWGWACINNVPGTFAIDAGTGYVLFQYPTITNGQYVAIRVTYSLDPFA